MSTYITCHGCQGKGWVDSVYYGPQVCPLCHGTGAESLNVSVTSEQTVEKEK